MSAARQYELVYIVSPVATDQEVADLHTQIETIAGKFAGTLEKTESWGRRKLAYEIGPHREGTYVLETLNGPAEMMKEMDRRLKVSDKILRHLVVRVDEETRIADRKKAEFDFAPPLDIVDGAARVCDPFFSGLITGEHTYGKFLKDYKPSNW